MKLKKNFAEPKEIPHGVNPYRGTAALLFFEPSTRTRFSFESACSRAGFHPLVLDGGIGTSLEKGETVEDTVANIHAMRPAFFVIRCQDQVDLPALDAKLNVPVVNAGWGRLGHPTQALLDALTIFEKYKTLKNKNILFIGDVKHSRVVSSHIELSRAMSYNVGVCAPEDFLTDDLDPRIKKFTRLKEALQWADAAMALRLQKERHDTGNIFVIEDYREHYGLNATQLKNLRPEALIMHPGPINYGIEVEANINEDPRSVILTQVENGVFIREALIRQILKGEL